MGHVPSRLKTTGWWGAVLRLHGGSDGGDCTPRSGGATSHSRADVSGCSQSRKLFRASVTSDRCRVQAWQRNVEKDCAVA